MFSAVAAQLRFLIGQSQAGPRQLGIQALLMEDCFLFQVRVGFLPKRDLELFLLVRAIEPQGERRHALLRLHI